MSDRSRLTHPCRAWLGVGLLAVRTWIIPLAKSDLNLEKICAARTVVAQHAECAPAAGNFFHLETGAVDCREMG